MTEQELIKTIDYLIEEGIADRLKSGLKRHRGKLIGGALGAGLGTVIGGYGRSIDFDPKDAAIGAGIGVLAGGVLGAKRVKKVFGQIFSVIGRGLVIMAEQEALRQQEVINNFKYAMTPYDEIKKSLLYLPHSVFTIGGSKYIDMIHVKMMAVHKTYQRVDKTSYNDIMSFYAYSQQQLKDIDELLEQAQAMII